MQPEDITALFTLSDGQFRFARWDRPIAPVIFGVDDTTLQLFHSAMRAAIQHAGHQMIETDPSSGANLFIFVMREWDELDDIPDLDALTGREGMAAWLSESGGNRARLFRFDENHAIRACFVFVRMQGAQKDAHPAALAEALIMGSLLSFAHEVAPTPELAALIRAAYDPVLPAASSDPATALRLSARLSQSNTVG